MLNLPVFTIKEIEKHRLKSGKTPDSAISKSKEKGLKFKGERYISADTIYSLSDDKYFCFKAVCIPSMKKGKRNIFVALDLTNGEVIHADCSCPAGKCGYCNHVMALLLEVADYSLHNLPEIPTEVSCTSRLRQWGVPGKSKSQAPVRQTTIQKSVDKKGISSTLYNPKKTVAVIEEEHMSRMVKMRDQMKLLNSNSGFDNCFNLPSSNTKTVRTSYGDFFFGSSLSHQLHPLPFDLEIVTDIERFESSVYTYENFVDLPLRFFVPESDMIPSNWSLNDLERKYISSITVTNDSCKLLEKDTVGHSESKLWVFSVARKINSSNSH